MAQAQGPSSVPVTQILQPVPNQVSSIAVVTAQRWTFSSHNNNRNSNPADPNNVNTMEQNGSGQIKRESGSPSTVISFNMPSFKFLDLHEPHKILSSDLIQNVLCVDCDSVPMTQIYSCTSGHIICHQCAIKLDPCSVCSQSRTNTRNVLAENIVAKMMKFKCPRRVTGCSEILSYSDIERHLTDECAYRPIPCHVDNDGKGLCTGQLVAFNQYAGHVKDHHSPPEKGNKNFEIQSDSVTHDQKWPVQCISFEGKLFFVHGINRDSVCYIWVTMFESPIGNSSESYWAIISLVKRCGRKIMTVFETIPVQQFRKPFHEVKAEGVSVCLSKEEFVALAKFIRPGGRGGGGNGGTQNDEVGVYKYSWMLNTTIGKRGVHNELIASDDNHVVSPRRQGKDRDSTSRQNEEGHEPTKKDRQSQSSSSEGCSV